jgi:ATP-dependent DNA helicase RecQ
MRSNLLLLTAPPAAGKTFLVQEMMKQIDQRFLVIAPLRALANECKSNWNDQCDVMTPEEWMVKKIARKVVVIDEFHLLFYWGDTFRERMWQCFYEVVQDAELVLLLTATITSSMRDEMAFFNSQFDQLLWIDCGNQQLKNLPHKYYYFPEKKWFWDNLAVLKPNQGVGLIFCQYRQEVWQWENQLLKLGFNCWSCVGGEAGVFSERVRSQKAPDFIVATTVLSHGVNLPSISRVIFTYPVKNVDFWIQMVARGGRRGERFDVFSVELPVGLSWNRASNFLAIQLIKLKIEIKHFFLAIQEWFLKA